MIVVMTTLLELVLGRPTRTVESIKVIVRLVWMPLGTSPVIVVPLLLPWLLS